MKYTSLLLACIAILLAGSCTEDFEETNSNPNYPTKVGAQYFAPPGLTDLY